MGLSYTTARRTWDVFIALCAVLAALYVPYALVFGAEHVALLWWFEIAISLIFGVDLAVRYWQRGMGSGAGPPARSPLGTGTLVRLTFDALAALPMFAITGTAAWLWLRPLKLHRVARLIRLLRDHEIKYAAFVQMASFLFWLGLATHWIACGWIALTGAAASGSGSRYIGGLYWTVTTLTTVGYGDIYPQTDPQRLYTMCVMVLGVGMYGFIIGNIAHILGNIDPVRAGQLRRMEQLAAFMRYRQLPSDLQERVADYFRYLWRQRLDHDETEILRRLPPALQTDVGLFLKRDLLDRVPLFENASEAFLREVAMGMQPVIFLPGDRILSAGDPGTGMYFITRGRVEIVSADGITRLATLSEGDFFGEMALVFDEPRSASARALDYCDIYRLEREMFQRLLRVYPQVAAQIEAAARLRRDANLS